jgi:HemY protein
MVKLIIGLLFLVIVVLLGVLFVKNDPGFMMVRYGDFSLETSLAFGVVAVALAGVALQIVFRLSLAIWRLPNTLAKQAERRRVEKSRKLLNIALIDLAEGRFEQSEAKLIKLIDYAENPLLNYLAAARAAHNLSKYDQRDNYLKAAHEVKPEAEIAIGVTQAELQLNSNQTERALATLNNLRSLAPRHDYVLKLLTKVYVKIEDWSLLCDLLPEVRRKKLFKEEQLKDIETKVYNGCLNEAATREGASLEKTWAKIPKTYQSDAHVTLHFLNLLSRYRKDHKLCEQIVVKAVNHQWNNQLIAYYGKLAVDDTSAQMANAERWLQEYGSSDVLLLALGRICIRLKLWGKAQSYLEASIGIKPGPEACLELANLLNRKEINETGEACKYYRQGLELSLVQTEKPLK